MQTMTWNRRGQVTVEVAILFGFLIAAFIALAVYFQRGGQGYVKSNADAFGSQFQANAAWGTHTRSATRETATTSQSSQYTQACQGVGGATLPNCDPGPLATSAPNPTTVELPP